MAETNREKLDRFGMSPVFSGSPEEAIRTQRSLLHADFEIIEAPSLPYGGTYRGGEGWAQLIEDVKKAWAGVKVTPLWTLGEHDGDRFAKMYRISGTARTTGIKFDMQVFELWEFEDGLIRRTVPYYFDTAELRDAHRGTGS